jgi:hypothetical protein
MDVNGGGSYPNTNGSPIQPGTNFTGPVLAGGVFHTDGTGNLAGLGGQTGTANTGYAVMAQTAVITQANGTTPGAPNGVATAGVFTTGIVLPAQSQILQIQIMVTTVWSGVATTFELGTTAGTTAATSLAAAGIAGGTAGLVQITPTTTAQIANWDNTSNSTFQTVPADIQVVVTSANTGTGVGTLTIRYIQGVNNAS